MNITVKSLTASMNRIEKNINWFNKKYNYDMSNAPVKHQKEYNMCLSMWDSFKAKRDQLKAA